MLRGSSDSDGSSEGDDPCDSDSGQREWTIRPVLRPSTLGTPMEQEQARAAWDQEREAMAQTLVRMEAQGEALARMRERLEAERAQLQEERERRREIGAQWELVQIFAATSMELRKDIESIERFDGNTGDLNHFIRSGDKVAGRIELREREGRLDAVEADALRGAITRRVSRNILNRLQAEEETPWTELKRRLQKEYGGGRWTPEEDALRMLQLKRGPRQTRGDFAAQLLMHYNVMVDKYRETLPGPEASNRLAVIETLAVVHLGVAVGKQFSGSLAEAANGLIDAAGRGEEEGEMEPRGPREWTQVTRRREWTPRGGGRNATVYRREERGPRDRMAERRPEGRNGDRRKGGDGERRRGGGEWDRRRVDERRCFTCGQRGHIQAKCRDTKCYECQTPGHVARNCPYLRPSRGRGGEPMEVNYHQTARSRDTESQGSSQEAGRPKGRTEDESTTDDEGAPGQHTYAMICSPQGGDRPGLGRRANQLRA